MEFENLLKLTDEQRKEILSDLIQNDVSYWKKILILTAMVENDEDTELLDLIINNKIEEINLANKIYNLSIKHDEKSDEKQINYSHAMKKILEETDDPVYNKACREVLEILNHIPEKYRNMINKNFVKRLEKKADKNYEFKISSDAKFTDINIFNETKEILLLINNKFWNIDGKSVNIDEIFNK